MPSALSGSKKKKEKEKRLQIHQNPVLPTSTSTLLPLLLQGRYTAAAFLGCCGSGSKVNLAQGPQYRFNKNKNNKHGDPRIPSSLSVNRSLGKDSFTICRGSPPLKTHSFGVESVMLFLFFFFSACLFCFFVLLSFFLSSHNLPQQEPFLRLK